MKYKYFFDFPRVFTFKKGDKEVVDCGFGEEGIHPGGQECRVGKGLAYSEAVGLH